MRIGKAHPAEPVIVRAEPIEPGDGAIGNPVGVVMFARNGIEMDLAGAGIAAAFGIHLKLVVEVAIKTVQPVGVILLEPLIVMQDERRMGCELHVVETAMRTELADAGHAVLIEFKLRIEKGLEMRLADERGLVAGLVVQIGGDAGRVVGQRHAVHPDTVGRNILAGDHGCASRHADDVLIVRPGIVDAFAGQTVDRRRAADAVAIASQRIEPHLIGGDEQNFAAHKRPLDAVQTGEGV